MAVEKLKSFVESRKFEVFIISVIALNSITLGLETVKGLSQEAVSVLTFIDRIFLTIFTVEIALKLLIYRFRFFREAWRVFDFVVVAVALVPAAGPFSVLRALRVLRTLRMVSVIPVLRKVISGLLAAIPGLGAVGTILGLVFYVGAVMATKLFGETFPDWFGSIGESAYSLFQIMTLESWSMGIVRPVMDQHPQAWLFFIPFIVLTTFTMLNLFIAVIVNAMHAETEDAAQERAEASQQERLQLQQDVSRLNKKVDEIHALLSVAKK